MNSVSFAEMQKVMTRVPVHAWPLRTTTDAFNWNHSPSWPSREHCCLDTSVSFEEINFYFNISGSRGFGTSSFFKYKIPVWSYWKNKGRWLWQLYVWMLFENWMIITSKTNCEIAKLVGTLNVYRCAPNNKLHKIGRSHTSLHWMSWKWDF